MTDNFGFGFKFNDWFRYYSPSKFNKFSREHDLDMYGEDINALQALFKKYGYDSLRGQLDEFMDQEPKSLKFPTPMKNVEVPYTDPDCAGCGVGPDEDCIESRH
tara:strand:- start:87136 stop:87447 length:312 start_codon:yes stop_codon:yes gene_type:complete